MNISNFTDLFADSATTGKLTNFSITDFGEKIKWAKVSFGNVPLGIYRRGPKKKKTPIFHDKQSDIYQLATNLTQKAKLLVSLRNFQQKIRLNFTPAEFDQGLYFTTFTFNNYQTALLFSFSPQATARSKKCPLKNSHGNRCNGKHLYSTISPITSSFLATKKIAKKRASQELEGVNDLLVQLIHSIQTIWRPHDFKYVAVPELHKCQTLCHWQGQKHRKSSWKNHAPENCGCSEKHECRRNWHIHMLSTEFLPPKYFHKHCGLGQYDNQGNSRGCRDHCAYIVHDLWPYGLVDIKRVSPCPVGGESTKSAERIILYLTKYLAKAFQMRTNPELAEKVGLLPRTRIYKFFRVIYGYYEDQRNGISLAYISEKIRKPICYSQVFINNNHGCPEQIKKEFAPYFTADLKLKKQAKKILRKREGKQFIWQPRESWPITDILKMCLRFASHSSIKRNHYWKPCDTSEEPVWKEGKGWQIHCPITKEHHCEPIIRWEFEFKNQVAYTAFKAFIQPALQSLNLPRFYKYDDYQVSEDDYRKFAVQAELPWNRAISEYAPCEELGESSSDKKWQEKIPPKLIYNYVYLAEIRNQLKNYESNWEISPEKAQTRYADY